MTHKKENHIMQKLCAIFNVEKCMSVNYMQYDPASNDTTSVIKIIDDSVYFYNFNDKICFESRILNTFINSGYEIQLNDFFKASTILFEFLRLADRLIIPEDQELYLANRRFIYKNDIKL